MLLTFRKNELELYSVETYFDDQNSEMINGLQFHLILTKRIFLKVRRYHELETMIT